LNPGSPYGEFEPCARYSVLSTVFDSTREVAYVVGFGDNNISVIDLRPGSTTEYHVVQRMGFPRVTPR